jgi:Acid Phosphatase
LGEALIIDFGIFVLRHSQIELKAYKERERERERMGKGKRQEEKRGEKEKAKGEKKVKVEALEIIGRFSGNSLPSLVVFDLDYTLWPFYSYQFFFLD